MGKTLNLQRADKTDYPVSLEVTEKKQQQ